MAMKKCAVEGCANEFSTMSGRATKCYDCRGGWREKKHQVNLGVKKDRAAMFERVAEPVWLELELVRVHGSAWLVKGGGAREPVWIGMKPAPEKCKVELRWEAYNYSRVVAARPKCQLMGWFPWMYDDGKVCRGACDPCRVARHINYLRQEMRDSLRGGRKKSCITDEEVEMLCQPDPPTSPTG